MIVAVETGGTKVICGFVSEQRPQRLLGTRRIATTTPVETLAAINAFFDEVQARHSISALGVASFGPVNVDPRRERWGWVLGTPKPEWSHTDLMGGITLSSRVPTTMLADVGAAALGEQAWGVGAGFERVAYATFGTGVGVGVALDGELMHGNGFPELGHMLVRRHPADDFAGACPFHADCLEGLASGPAVLGRWGCETSALGVELRDEAFEILGSYIAQFAAVTGYLTGVERFVVGGGVLKAPGLLGAARAQLPRVTGGPGASHGAALDDPEFLVEPALGDHSGLLGAVAAALALTAHRV
jgi:fructokinase